MYGALSAKTQTKSLIIKLCVKLAMMIQLVDIFIINHSGDVLTYRHIYKYVHI